MEDILAAEDADDPETEALLDSLPDDDLASGMPGEPLEEEPEDDDLDDEREPRIRRARDAPKRTHPRYQA